jgi:hypothetical protein
MPAFMPVNFGKVPSPFDFSRLTTEDAGKSRHEAIYIVLAVLGMILNHLIFNRDFKSML